MELYYPVRNPINPTNLFGANPDEYAPQLGHPGNDFQCPLGTPIFAPCDGDAFFVGPDANGGCGFYIRTPNNGEIQHTVILWHLPPKGDPTITPVLPEDGSIHPVKVGQLIGHTGNSGYPKESTGPHLHLGIFPCNAVSAGAPINPKNGYGGCIDPAPFFNGKLAEDIALEQQVVEKSAKIVQLISTATDAQISHQDKLSVLKKVEQYLLSFL